MAMNAVANRGKLIDAECYLHGTPGTPVTIGGRGATGVTGNGYGATGIGGAALIFDTGGGLTNMMLNIDLATAGTLATQSYYAFHMQMSDGAAMATPVVDRPVLVVGSAPAVANEKFCGNWGTRAITNHGNNRQRFLLPINNDFGGTCYRYLRLFHEVRKFTAASVDLGLHYCAWLTVEP